MCHSRVLSLVLSSGMKNQIHKVQNLCLPSSLSSMSKGIYEGGYNESSFMSTRLGTVKNIDNDVQGDGSGGWLSASQCPGEPPKGAKVLPGKDPALPREAKLHPMVHQEKPFGWLSRDKNWGLAFLTGRGSAAHKPASERTGSCSVGRVEGRHKPVLSP